MTQASELIATQMANASGVQKVWGGIIVNVALYGATGDGVTDDYGAFVKAIAACTSRDVLFIPRPSKFYRISQKITINKPMRIEGTHFKISMVDNPTIVFDAAVTTGFELTSQDTAIEKLFIKMLNSTNTMVAGIHLNNPLGGSMANVMLSDLMIYLSGSFGTGLKGINTTTSKFRNVRTFQGQYGFYFDVAGTSLNFDTCWAMSNTKTGFYLQSYEYCSFVNCACDSPNNPDYGYHIYGCNGISFISCGAEGLGKSMFRLQSCNGADITGCRAVGMNHAGTAIASFAEQSDSSNINFIGCMESGATGTLPNVSATGSLYPIIMNCNFTKIKMDANTYTDTAYEVRGSLKLGGMAIQISPYAGAASFIKNHNLYMSEQSFGVVKADGSAIYGYFDADGGIVTRTFTSLPPAAVAHRGKIARVEGGTGVSDKFYICEKNASEAYVWRQI